MFCKINKAIKLNLLLRKWNLPETFSLKSKIRLQLIIKCKFHRNDLKIIHFNLCVFHIKFLSLISFIWIRDYGKIVNHDEEKEVLECYHKLTVEIYRPWQLLFFKKKLASMINTLRYEQHILTEYVQNCR